MLGGWAISEADSGEVHGGTCAGGECVGVDVGGGDREGEGEGGGMSTGSRSGPSSDINICRRRSVYVSELSVPERSEPLELPAEESGEEDEQSTGKDDMMPTYRS